MNYSERLSKAKAAFIEHRSRGRHPYAAELKKEAVMLLGHYTAQVLSRELGVTANTLTEWKKSTDAAPLPTFVPLSLPTNAVATVENKIFTLTLPHQVELKLPMASMKEMAVFMAGLIKELSPCSI